MEFRNILFIRTKHKVIIIYLNDDASEKNVFTREHECDTVNAGVRESSIQVDSSENLSFLWELCTARKDEISNLSLLN